jgi:hypothetical protein
MLSQQDGPGGWGGVMLWGREVWVGLGGFWRVWMFSVVEYLHEALSY